MFSNGEIATDSSPIALSATRGPAATSYDALANLPTYHIPLQERVRSFISKSLAELQSDNVDAALLEDLKKVLSSDLVGERKVRFEKLLTISVCAQSIDRLTLDRETPLETERTASIREPIRLLGAIYSLVRISNDQILSNDIIENLSSKAKLGTNLEKSILNIYERDILSVDSKITASLQREFADKNTIAETQILSGTLFGLTELFQEQASFLVSLYRRISNGASAAIVDLHPEPLARSLVTFLDERVKELVDLDLVKNARSQALLERQSEQERNKLELAQSQAREAEAKLLQVQAELALKVASNEELARKLDLTSKSVEVLDAEKVVAEATRVKNTANIEVEAAVREKVLLDKKLQAEQIRGAQLQSTITALKERLAQSNEQNSEKRSNSSTSLTKQILQPAQPEFGDLNFNRHSSKEKQEYYLAHIKEQFNERGPLNIFDNGRMFETYHNAMKSLNLSWQKSDREDYFLAREEWAARIKTASKSGVKILLNSKEMKYMHSLNKFPADWFTHYEDDTSELIIKPHAIKFEESGWGSGYMMIDIGWGTGKYDPQIASHSDYAFLLIQEAMQNLGGIYVERVPT